MKRLPTLLLIALVALWLPLQGQVALAACSHGDTAPAVGEHAHHHAEHAGAESAAVCDHCDQCGTCHGLSPLVLDAVAAMPPVAERDWVSSVVPSPPVPVSASLLRPPISFS